MRSYELSRILDSSETKQRTCSEFSLRRDLGLDVEQAAPATDEADFGVHHDRQPLALKPEAHVAIEEYLESRTNSQGEASDASGYVAGDVSRTDTGHDVGPYPGGP